jgi:hypothetical protein
MLTRYELTCLIGLLCIVTSCASPMKVDTVSFKPPSATAGCQVVEGLELAVVPIDTEARSKEVFGTDLKSANILPVHLIVKNSGRREFEINNTQIFGVTGDGQYTVAYTLNRAAQRVRQSSIGTTAVTGAVAGAALGAAVGAGLGAAAGNAAGNTSGGAASGAALGGAIGGTGGLSEGLSDSVAVEFKKQLAILAFGDRVIFPGDVQQGFIYLKWQPYTDIRVNVFDITGNQVHELHFPVLIAR